MKRSELVTLVLINAALASCKILPTPTFREASSEDTHVADFSALPALDHWQQSFAPVAYYMAADSISHAHHSGGSHSIYRGGFGVGHHSSAS